LAIRRLTKAKPEFNIESLKSQIDLEYSSLVDEASAKDTEFKEFKRNEIIKTAIFAGVAGAAVGGAIRFVGGAVIDGVKHIFGGSEVLPFAHGIVIPSQTVSTSEHLTPEQVTTMREAGYGVVEHSRVVKAEDFLGQQGMHAESLAILNPGVTINLPNGLRLVPDGASSGIYNIVDANGSSPTVYAKGLDLSSGTLSGADIQKLKELGFGVNASEQVVPNVLTDRQQIFEELQNRYGKGVSSPTKRIWHGNINETYDTTSLDNPNLKGDIDFSKPNLPYEHTVTAEDINANEAAYQGDITDTRVQVGDKVRGTIFDGREIMSKAGVGKDGVGVFDASRNIKDMLKGGPHTADGVYDHRFDAVKKLFHGKKLSDVAPQFSYRFYASKADFASGHAAFSLPVGPDGKIAIDPDTQPDLFNLLFKPDGKPRLTAEIAFTDDKGIDHIFATNVRQEITELEIPTTLENFDIKLLDTVVTDHDVISPPVSVEIPSKVDDGVDVIPLPFAPRKDMGETRMTGEESGDKKDPEKTPPPPPENPKKGTKEKETKPEKPEEFSKEKIDSAIEDYLSYQDADLKVDAKKEALKSSKENKNARIFAESFLKLEKKHGKAKFAEVAKSIHDKCQQFLQSKDIPVSTFGKSKTWTYWDMAKQFYYSDDATGIEESKNHPEYKPGDPIAEERLQQEILNRHIGWEVWNAWFVTERDVDTRDQSEALLDKLGLKADVKRKLKVKLHTSLNDVAEGKREDVPSYVLEEMGKIILSGQK